MHNIESVNWRADWSKFCNRSYAQVVKQNTQPRLEPQKYTKVMSHHTEVSQAKSVFSRHKTNPNQNRQPQGWCDQPCAASEAKIGKPKTTNTKEKDLFQLLVKKKFSLLSQQLQSIIDTETSLNVNAPEYVPIANRQVKEKGQTPGQMYVSTNRNSVGRKHVSVKAPLVYNDFTNKNCNQKVRQCNNLQGTSHASQPVYDVTPTQNSPADTEEVSQGNPSTQVVKALYQASNEFHSTSRQNIGMLCDNARVDSQCKSGGGSVLKPKGPVTLTDSFLKTKIGGLMTRTNLFHSQMTNTAWPFIAKPRSKHCCGKLEIITLSRNGSLKTKKNSVSYH